MPLFFHLLINDHFQVDFFNNLYILSTFNNVSLPFREVHLIEGRPQTTLLNHGQFFDVNQNLLVRALKNTFSKSSVFFHLSTLNNQETSCFQATVHAFVILSHVLYSALIDWLLFKGEQIRSVSLNFI